MKLVLTGFAVPGLAQYRLGYRVLGRVSLALTGVVWLVLLFSGIAAIVRPDLLAGAVLAPNSVWAGLATTGAVFYGLLWLFVVVHTGVLASRRAAQPRMRVVIALTTSVAVAIIGCTAGYSGYAVVTTRQAIDSVVAAGESAAPIDGRYNILLLGTDAGPDRSDRRTDSISVVSVNAVTGSVVFIGLPRQLQQIPLPVESPLRQDWASGIYDCGSDCQLGFLYQRTERCGANHYPDAASQHSSPGIEAVRDATEGALGITLQYYVRVDMHGFESLIDALGGVEITVSERLPIGGDARGVGIAGWIEPGKQRMDGLTALWYARSRQSTSDYGRMNRQRELQRALITQQNPVTVVASLSGIAVAASDAVSTDLTDGMLSELVVLALRGRGKTTATVELVPPSIDVVHPDYAQIHRDVASALASGGPP